MVSPETAVLCKNCPIETSAFKLVQTSPRVKYIVNETPVWDVRCVGEQLLDETFAI